MHNDTLLLGSSENTEYGDGISISDKKLCSKQQDFIERKKIGLILFNGISCLFNKHETKLCSTGQNIAFLIFSDQLSKIRESGSAFSSHVHVFVKEGLSV